jgi:hypothetical protein
MSMSDSMQTDTNDTVAKYLLKLTIPQLNELRYIVTYEEFEKLKLIRRRANNRHYSKCSRANKANAKKPKNEHIIINVAEEEQGEQGE